MQKGRVQVTVSGFVQGVFYRASTREMASRLGLKGWVKNLPNGDVEALFEGPADRLHKAVQWCHEGPPGSRVAGVDEKWLNYSGEFKSFEIKY